MMQQVLSHYHLPALACAGLGLFLAVFVGAVVWVCRRGSGEFYSAMEALPFEENVILIRGARK
jgi:hypothetical protein